MPIYCYRCPSCDTERDVNKPMRFAGRTERCKECDTRLERDYLRETPAVVPDSQDWSAENGGKGRRNPQLDPDKGRDHFRSRKEMVAYLRGQHTDAVGAQGRTLVVHD
jgi:hypothetical protein